MDDFGVSCEQAVHIDDAIHFLMYRSNFKLFDQHNKLLLLFLCLSYNRTPTVPKAVVQC